MKPDISEFSYGYAITESLIKTNAFGLQAAPIFPSLIREGQEGGGYDVKLPFDGMPLFLQFKLSDFMKGRSSKESNIIGVPYYRMHLRPLKYSEQHQMLLDLEDSGQTVYYVAPKFHTPVELNEAYLARQVENKSVFIQPSQIGNLDDQNHYVVFNDDNEPIVFSESRKSIHHTDYQAFISHISSTAVKVGNITADKQVMQKLQNTLIEIIEHVKPQIELWKRISRQDLIGNRSELLQTAYLSRTFFGCEMYVVRVNG